MYYPTKNPPWPLASSGRPSRLPLLRGLLARRIWLRAFKLTCLLVALAAKAVSLLACAGTPSSVPEVTATTQVAPRPVGRLEEGERIDFDARTVNAASQGLPPLPGARKGDHPRMAVVKENGRVKIIRIE